MTLNLVLEEPVCSRGQFRGRQAFSHLLSLWMAGVTSEWMKVYSDACLEHLICLVQRKISLPCHLPHLPPRESRSEVQHLFSNVYLELFVLFYSVCICGVFGIYMYVHICAYIARACVCKVRG